jgi:RimJ/RimL family protein N-acetyltransferase
VPELHHPDPRLSDGVIVLRPVVEDDVQSVVEACQDAQIKRFLSRIPDPYGDEEARSWMATHAEDAAQGVEINFAIASVEEDDALLGVIGLHDFSWRDRRAATGYWMAPWARRRGLAVRATRLVSEWALSELALVRVSLLADIENTPSMRVAEHAGFIREGTLHKHLMLGGRSRDCAVFGRIAPD